MKVYCTYCAAKKKEDPCWLPAIIRYDSPRIRSIFAKAEKDDVDFFILSGQYGLIAPDHEIPNYDRKLSFDEVGYLSEIVAYQLKLYKITELVYFSENLESDYNIRPYHDTIASACSKAGVQFYLSII